MMAGAVEGERILNALQLHQDRCGSFRIVDDKGSPRMECDTCGLTVTKDGDHPVIETKGVRIEFY